MKLFKRAAEVATRVDSDDEVLEPSEIDVPNALKSSRAAQAEANSGRRGKGVAFFDGFSRDIDMVAGEGQVLFVQMSNFLRSTVFYGPVLAMGVAALAITSWMVSAAPLELMSTRTPGNAANLLQSTIGFDPNSAITLPDGTQGHVRWAFLNNLPAARTGSLNVAAFKEAVELHQEVAAENGAALKQQQSKITEISSLESQYGQFDTRLWKAWQDAKATVAEVKDTTLPTVPAIGFWKSHSNTEAMAATGIVARSADGTEFVAAAYIDGVPSINLMTGSGCSTVIGAPLSESCSRLTASDAVPEIVRSMYAPPIEQHVENAQPSGIPEHWYLNLPSSDQSISLNDFDTTLMFLQENLRHESRFSWNAKVWEAAASLSAFPQTVIAQGLWKNPSAIKAMETGTVISTTGKQDEYVVAAFVDGKPAARLVTRGHCRTIFGPEHGDCSAGDISAYEQSVRSLYNAPPASALVAPFSFYGSAPFHGDAAMDREGYFGFFNAVLRDFSTYGGSREGLSKWQAVAKLDKPAHMARPLGFFTNEKNVSALSTGGAVILPEGKDDTFLVAANVDGNLNLNIVEIRGRSFACSVVFGLPYVGECQYEDLGRHADLLKSLFAKQ